MTRIRTFQTPERSTPEQTSTFNRDGESFLRVFYDTEFTNIALGAGLIAIGFAAAGYVTADGKQHEGDTLYIELADGWRRDECSQFVVDVVLPLLGRHDPECLRRSAAAARIEEWLDGLRGGDRSVQTIMLSDSTWDWEHLKDLFSLEPGTDPWARSFNIAGRLIASDLMSGRAQRIFDEELAMYFERRSHSGCNDQHHALVDAIAARHAYREAHLDSGEP